MIKNVHIWLPSYLIPPKRERSVSPTHVFFCFVDHYEPLWHNATPEQGLERVRYWRTNYPTFADKFRDADGRPPQHTFFFPAEEYRPELLDELTALCRAGYGEVEIHLHHDNDTAENLKSQITNFKSQLQNHGFLSNGRYGFIHGNWALDNSRRDGCRCGVNNELQVLRDTGCYADFTLPSAPSDTQTRKINSIYYATDDPHRPKSHDDGVDVRVNTQPTGDLLLVQGPLTLNWHSRKWGVLPRIENAEIACYAPATPTRINLWVQQRIGVLERPDWIFVKVHTHGCQERNFDVVLGESAARMHENLGRQDFVLHYVTAREVFNLIKAAEAGKTGDPNQFRDFILPPPPIRSRTR